MVWVVAICSVWALRVEGVGSGLPQFSGREQADSMCRRTSDNEVTEALRGVGDAQGNARVGQRLGDDRAGGHCCGGCGEQRDTGVAGEAAVVAQAVEVWEGFDDAAGPCLGGGVRAGG